MKRLIPPYSSVAVTLPLPRLNDGAARAGGLRPGPSRGEEQAQMRKTAAGKDALIKRLIVFIKTAPLINEAVPKYQILRQAQTSPRKAYAWYTPHTERPAK